MKIKIGTIIEEDIFKEAKQRALREGKNFAEVLQDALVGYLHEEISSGEYLRSCEKFCSHGNVLSTDQINDFLRGA